MQTVIFDEIGCHDYEFAPGKYFIELFGAQGGQCGETPPYGGYASGILRVSLTTTYYICVGEQGKTATNGTLEGGFNGGGAAGFGKYQEYQLCGGSGGGRTDIRRNKVDNTSVLIVAGGGGGDGSWNETVYKGGRGGGIKGEDGEGIIENIGKGASNLSPGKGGNYAGTSNSEDCIASDGEYLNGGKACSSSGASSGGGGGGYFGGGGGADYSGGGGGSGYISSFIIHGNIGYSNKSGNGFVSIIEKFNFASCQNCLKLVRYDLLLFIFIGMSTYEQ